VGWSPSTALKSLSTRARDNPAPYLCLHGNPWTMTIIRPEIPTDCGAIAALNFAAFGGEDEAGIVDRLRADGFVIASLVAEEKRETVGHIMFSELPIETRGRRIRGAALVPIAVAPAYQQGGLDHGLSVRTWRPAAPRESNWCWSSATLITTPASGFPRNWPNKYMRLFRNQPSWLWNWISEFLMGWRVSLCIPMRSG